MDENYRNKLKDIEKCLKVLDEAELPAESVEFINKSWATMMLAYANKFPTPEHKHSLVFLKQEIDENGNFTLELSKASMQAPEEQNFNRFMFACRSGDICHYNEADCEDIYKEVRVILGYGEA